MASIEFADWYARMNCRRPEEAAAILGLSHHTIRELLKRRLPVSRRTERQLWDTLLLQTANIRPWGDIR